jgi:hypothetical protein
MPFPMRPDSRSAQLIRIFSFVISSLILVAPCAAVGVDKPVISGTAQVGQTLTGASYAYQWNRSPGGAIPGASGKTYVPTTADIGTRLSLTVATFVGGVLTSYEVSAATGIVVAAGSAPVNTAPPAISGPRRSGKRSPRATGHGRTARRVSPTNGNALGRRSPWPRPRPTFLSRAMSETH